MLDRQVTETRYDKYRVSMVRLTEREMPETRGFLMSEYGRFHLADHDPSPLEVVGAEFEGEFILTCEHAGRAVPDCLGDLGVDPVEMERHIAYDVGAEAISRRLSAALRAPLYIQRYSRLVIDCNRPLAASDSIPDVSDATLVPANVGLTEEERELRYSLIHRPYHQAVSAALDRFAARGKKPILLAIHSFTPVLRKTGEVRECELGLLFNKDGRFASAILSDAAKTYPDVKVALNVPYSVDDLSDYTIPVHGERRGIPHVLIEIRSDQILDETGQSRWADILTNTVLAAAKKMELEHDGL